MEAGNIIYVYTEYSLCGEVIVVYNFKLLIED